MGQNRVTAVAMAESDELEIVDDDDVTCRKHDIVHTVHVDGGGAANAAGKAPFSSEKNRVPGRDKNGSGV